MAVIFGTFAFETALTSLAPFLAMPSYSNFLPTIKPVIFYKKIIGVLRLQHSWTKWEPFRALSEKSTPLFATIPTGIP